MLCRVSGCNQEHVPVNEPREDTSISPESLTTRVHDESRQAPMPGETNPKVGRRRQSVTIGAIGLAVGTALAIWALGHAGSRLAYALVIGALPILPLAAAIEGARIGAEALAARSLFCAIKRPIPLSVLSRAQLFGYSVGNLLPVGRVAAEVSKATVLSSHAPLADTSAVGTAVQAIHLLASAIILVPCIAAARSSHASLALAATLLVQCAVLAGAGGALLIGARFAPASGGAFRRLPRVSAALEQFRSALRRLPSFPGAALGWVLVNRLLQVVLIALLLSAVGATLSLARPFVGQAVVITGATAFDFVPGQVGALEGAFGLFAKSMDLTVPAAVAVALLIHVIQFLWVLLGVGAMLFARRRADASAVGRTVSVQASTVKHRTVLPLGVP
jgi:Lysylphosphatidylglycerol synthase TM region